MAEIGNLRKILGNSFIKKKLKKQKNSFAYQFSLFAVV